MQNTLEFYKYHGTGNDFILINAWDTLINLDQETIQKICHRRFGIGADGLMILRRKEGYDFFMDFYNSDGKPGTMCGNGGRCIVAFAHDLGIISNKTHFLAPDGPHQAEYYSNEKIKLQMANVSTIEKHALGLFIDTGSPHLVITKEEDKTLDVYQEGKKIRYNETYKKHGTNVNFIIPNAKMPKIFTYERGVEDETYSCGTGTVASALCLNHLNKFPSPIKLQARGGQLLVHFKKVSESHYEDIWLEGPAKKTFKGTYHHGVNE